MEKCQFQLFFTLTKYISNIGGTLLKYTTGIENIFASVVRRGAKAWLPYPVEFATPLTTAPSGYSAG